MFLIIMHSSLDSKSSFHQNCVDVAMGKKATLNQMFCLMFLFDSEKNVQFNAQFNGFCQSVKEMISDGLYSF